MRKDEAVGNKKKMQVCLPATRSRIPDLGSRIPDPKIATKERGEKNLLS
jgi:hypothetical protein